MINGVEFTVSRSVGTSGWVSAKSTSLGLLVVYVEVRDEIVASFPMLTCSRGPVINVV